MIVPRSQHAATLLADGDLLVAGGEETGCCTSTSSAEIYTPALVTVTPAHGPAGQVITVTGSNFYAGERVQVSFDYTTPIGTTTTTATGSFTLHTKIPSTAAVGDHTVRAAGQTSSTIADVTFTVT